MTVEIVSMAHTHTHTHSQKKEPAVTQHAHTHIHQTRCKVQISTDENPGARTEQRDHNRFLLRCVLPGQIDMLIFFLPHENELFKHTKSLMHVGCIRYHSICGPKMMGHSPNYRHRTRPTVRPSVDPSALS